MRKKRKSKNQIQEWQVNKLNESKFAMMYADLRLCDQFKGLSGAARKFYTDCRINACRSVARKSLAAHITEDMQGEDTAVIQNTITGMLEDCFVMPAKHLAEFGYTRQQGYNYMLELQKAGFVEVVERNKHRRKENIYKFSTNFKNPDQLKRYVEQLEKQIADRKAKRKIKEQN